jgi:hypothetical protein
VSRLLNCLAPARLPRTSLAALLGAASLSLGLASASTASTKRPPRPTCRSGHTLFQRAGVRVFDWSFYDALDKGPDEQIRICLPRSPRPSVLYDAGPFNSVDAGDFRIIGDRLGFVAHDEGFGAGAATDVGWVDVRTGYVRFGALDEGESANLLPDKSVGYAVAPDGATAVITGTTCQVVAVLAVKPNPGNAINRLGPAAVLFIAPNGGLARRSIAITATSVTWRTLSGAPESSPRSGGSTATRFRIGNC